MLIVVAALTLLATPFLFAAPHGPRGHRGGDFGFLGILGHAKQELNLSDQQVDDIKSIFKQLREQNSQYREQFRGGLGDVASTLLANPNDVAAAQAILDQQAQAERAMKQNALNATANALKVLTPEQRSKLGTMIEQRKAQRLERFQSRKESRRDR